MERMGAAGGRLAGKVTRAVGRLRVTVIRSGRVIPLNLLRVMWARTGGLIADSHFPGQQERDRRT